MTLKCFLVFLLMLTYAYGFINAPAQAVKCLEKLANSKAKGTTDQIFCARVKVSVDCLSEPSLGSNEVLDDFRYLAEQWSILITKFGICKTLIDVTALKEIVSKSGVKEEYKDYSIDNDKVEPCASEVHENCVKHWVAVFENKKLCNDFSQFMRCLHVENRKSGCKADIIRHMIALLDVVGNNIIEQIREHMDYECHDNQ